MPLLLLILPSVTFLNSLIISIIFVHYIGFFYVHNHYTFYFFYWSFLLAKIRQQCFIVVVRFDILALLQVLEENI